MSIAEEARPFISVIVPHLNQPEFLKACLASLARQTYPRERFEVVVVDNGSRELPEWVGNAGGNVTLDREAIPGPGPARNRGVAASRGEVLAFIDADCTADSRWLEAMSEVLFKSTDRRIVGGDVRIAYDNLERLTMIEAYETVFAYRQKEYIEKKGFSGTGNLMVRRGDFERIGLFAGIEVAEDRDWGQRAVAAGYRIVYAPNGIIYHPARRSLDEIKVKWRRHTDHDYAEWLRAGRGTALWCARAVAVAVSPIRDLARIARSDLLCGLRARWLASLALVRIRWWRAGRMLAVVTAAKPSLNAQSWNR